MKAETAHLKLATNADFSEIKQLILNFKAASPYGVYPTNELKVDALIWDALGKKPDEGIIILSKPYGRAIGLIYGLASELPFSDVKQAAESIWWVEPEFRNSRYGLDLFSAFEYWADRIGARILHSAAPKGVPLDRYYLKRGYEPLEMLYIRK